MATKVPIKRFVDFLVNRQLAKDGYIMGATGQDPKKWSKTSWWFAQYNPKSASKQSYASYQNHKQALYWRENAKRVWDCNGLAEGFYKDVTGIDINTKARYNYSGWCSVKGTGKVPDKHKVPGLAVFIGQRASNITHVGYLVAPVDPAKPNGDWYVIEARGVGYGVVKTKLNSRSWNFWGYMDKYFDYSNHELGDQEEDDVQFGDRTLRRGDTGDDVKELQKKLISLGYSLPKYGADGDFGSETERAVKKFQKDYELTVDGIVGKQTFAALDDPKPKRSYVLVTGGSVYVRPTASTAKKPITTVHKGDKFEYLGTEGNWHKIKINNTNAYITSRYTKVVEE